MTITYQSTVATGSLNGFAKLLFKWRGSIYKLVYKELIVFSVAYAAISITYRCLLNDTRRLQFEMVSVFCAHYIDMIPLSFVLGFYVSSIVTRWWNQFITIPFPDRLMNTVTMYVGGTDERGRLIRRTLMRYWNLSFVLLMSSISVAVKKRFPTTKHLVEAGFMTAEELHIYDSVQVKINKFWIAHTWFIKLLDQARVEGRVREGEPIKHILEELNDSRNNLRILWCHDWVTVPLVYTQVVTWGVHLFFMISLIGRQYLDPTKNYDGQEVDLYVPFFTIIQFLFYMGWLKVAEQLINPFGEDDDDIECNWLIDRHLQVSYLGVDELNCKNPTLQKDIYWDDIQPEVPYTEATLVHKIPSYNGSTTNIVVPVKRQTLIRRRAASKKNGSPQSSTPDPTTAQTNNGWSENQQHNNHHNHPMVTDIQSVTLPVTPPTAVHPADHDVSHTVSHRSSTSSNRPFSFLFKKLRSPGGGSLQPGSPPGENEKNAQLAQRTLGRRETLMGDHILALINTGRWTAAPAIPARPQLPHRGTNSSGSTEHLVIDVERPANGFSAMQQQRPTNAPPSRGSIKTFGRFLQSRRSSSGSQMSTRSFGSVSSVGSENMDSLAPPVGQELNNRYAFVNAGCTEMDETTEEEGLTDIFAAAQVRAATSTPHLLHEHTAVSRCSHRDESQLDSPVQDIPNIAALSRLSEVDEDVSEVATPVKVDENESKLESIKEKHS